MEITECLACGNKKLKLCIDFKTQFPVNRLLDNYDDIQDSYPLKLNYCPNCSHGQLSVSVPPKVLFSDYLYASGTSKTLTDYFSWFANEVYEEVRPDRILEIACNDGSLLKEFRKFGIDCTGIEPDKNLSLLAKKTDAKIVNGFWPEASVEGKFPLIVAMNVLAHVPEPLAFLIAIKEKLSPRGNVVIQVSHGDLLQTGQFDNVYHEHLSYFTLESMCALTRRAGLFILGAFRLNIHGKSDVYVLGHEGQKNSLRFLKKPPYFLEMTPGNKFRPEHIYERFRDLTLDNLCEIDYQILSAKRAGEKIAFIGAAAKAIGVVQQTTFKPDFVFDEAPLKIGKWIPGTKLQIKSFSEMKDLPENTLFIISAWNFKEELVRKVKNIRNGNSNFMVYFPEFKLWTE